MRLGLGFGFQAGAGQGIDETAIAIAWAAGHENGVFAEDDAPGTVIGTLSGGDGSNYSLSDDADGKVALSGANVIVGVGSLLAGSYEFVVTSGEQSNAVGFEILIYEANSVSFDGVNDYLTRDGGLTGAVDSKKLTLVFFIRKQGSDDSSERLFVGATTLGGTTERFRCVKASGNTIALVGFNAADSQILSIQASGGAVEVADGWVPVLIAVDMSDVNKRHLYIGDTLDLSVSVYNDDTFDFTLADWCIGARSDGLNKIEADFTHFWFMPGLYIDFSLESNRRKFLTPDGRPAFLGASGEYPTGTPPLVYMSGATDTWHVNDGSGGGFTENGALTDGGDAGTAGQPIGLLLTLTKAS